MAELSYALDGSAATEILLASDLGFRWPLVLTGQTLIVSKHGRRLHRSR